jgi:uncharacterized protein (TIGR03083 family)
VNAKGRDWYIGHVEADVAAMSAVVRRGPLDAAVDGCPGWDLQALTSHVGQVHRWARHCAANAAPPESFGAYAAPADLDANGLAEWLEAGASELVATLRTIDLDGPTWHPFPVARLGHVWPRRQAHEIAVHRWDAEGAVGTPHPIDAELASDGIDEYFELVIPRKVARDGTELPTGSLHLHCTDTHGEWLVWVDDDGYHLVRAHEKGDAALRGPAEVLLLRLWNRSSGREAELSPVGDESVLAAWLAVAGI